jgi:hypothetical protein
VDADPDIERRFARTNGDTNRDMDSSGTKDHIRLAPRSFWIDDTQRDPIDFWIGDLICYELNPEKIS